MKIYVGHCPEYSDELAFSDDVGARVAFARYSDKVDILEVYAHDPDPLVRRAVAQNPNTPADVLTILAEDPDLDVQMIVAENDNTATETLAELASRWSSYPDVLLSIACHEHTNDETLRKLLDVPYWAVSYAAKDELRRRGLL